MKTPISILQELMTAGHKAAPLYTTVEAPQSTGFSFQCTVTADGLTSIGYANTKQNAKQNSAEKLLKQMGYAFVNFETNNNNRFTNTSEKILPMINYVGKLNETASGGGKPYPEYSESIVPLNGTFSVTCSYISKTTSGCANTKKEAKQQAAKSMLELLRVSPADDTIPILDVNKVDKIDRLTEEIIKRMNQNILSVTKEHEPSGCSRLNQTKTKFETLQELTDHLSKNGYTCKITTIQVDPYVMIMEIEGTSCSSMKCGQKGGNHCRILGHGPTKIHALEEIKSTAEFMIVNKFSFNVSGNSI